MNLIAKAAQVEPNGGFLIKVGSAKPSYHTDRFAHCENFSTEYL